MPRRRPVDDQSRDRRRGIRYHACLPPPRPRRSLLRPGAGRRIHCGNHLLDHLRGLDGAEVHPGFLYGRITAVDDITYEGRLRWGGDQEAFWAITSTASSPTTPGPFTCHARRADRDLRVPDRRPDRSINLDRLSMARFGDIARIEPTLGNVQVTLKSGTMFQLDRFSAGDIDDGVRVSDGRRGVVDVDAGRSAPSSSSPPAPLAAAGRLHGTVARVRSTSPASSGGTRRRAPAATSSTAVPPKVS